MKLDSVAFCDVDKSLVIEKGMFSILAQLRLIASKRNWPILKNSDHV